MSEKSTNKYAIVDLEATSASSTACIIQVGIVIMQNGRVIDEFASDVNPHQKLDNHIVHLTGITDQQLSQAPDFSEIARTIFELIEDCIAHKDYKTAREHLRTLKATVHTLSQVDIKRYGK